jgi:hypothetical protein
VGRTTRRGASCVLSSPPLQLPIRPAAAHARQRSKRNNDHPPRNAHRSTQGRFTLGEPPHRQIRSNNVTSTNAARRHEQPNPPTLFRKAGGWDELPVAAPAASSVPLLSNSPSDRSRPTTTRLETLTDRHRAVSPQPTTTSPNSIRGHVDNRSTSLRTIDPAHLSSEGRAGGADYPSRRQPRPQLPSPPPARGPRPLASIHLPVNTGPFHPKLDPTTGISLRRIPPQIAESVHSPPKGGRLGPTTRRGASRALSPLLSNSPSDRPRPTRASAQRGTTTTHLETLTDRHRAVSPQRATTSPNSVQGHAISPSEDRIPPLSSEGAGGWANYPSRRQPRPQLPSDRPRPTTAHLETLTDRHRAVSPQRIITSPTSVQRHAISPSKDRICPLSSEGRARGANYPSRRQPRPQPPPLPTPHPPDRGPRAPALKQE